MDPAEVLGLPARPPSEVEWEDLLVRLDIAPRAVRLAVEDGRGEADAEVSRALLAAAGWEALLQHTLDAMTRGDEVPDGFGASWPGEESPLRALERQRRRTFALVQRRGLGVWEWRARGGLYPGASTYQLLQAAARMDARTLAAIRGAGRQG